MAVVEKQTLASRWKTQFAKALELDTWGQIEEAREIYENVALLIDQECKKEEPKQYSSDEMGIMSKLVLCLRLRANVLKHGDVESVSLANMNALQPVFQNLFTQQKMAFPFELSIFGEGDIQTASAVSPFVKEKEVVLPSAQGPNSQQNTGALLPAPPYREGLSFLDITIEKIGFKDETLYIDPFITITVVDALGRAVETSQDTPVSNNRKRNYILFGQTVHIQTPEASLPPGCAVFFEFRHYKPKKKKKSTKCFTFIEGDEMRPGPVSCELYLKPTDFSRKKKLHLMTVKPLYLHLLIQQRKD